MCMGRGMYFSMDAFLAVALLITGVILFTQLTPSTVDQGTLDYTSKDVLHALHTMKVSSIQNSWVQNNVADENFTGNYTLLQQIGELWALDRFGEAEYLAGIVLNDSMFEGVSVQILYENDIVFERIFSSRDDADVVSVDTKLLTGVAKGRPVSGVSGTAYLQRIRDKRTSKFLYFGGFVGQGNITGILELPADVNSTDITNAYLEVDAVQSFDFEVNGAVCLTNVTPTTTNMTSDGFNATACSFTAGNNTVRILFDSMNSAYIGGGFLRVDFTTDTFSYTQNTSTTTKYLPGINGIINLYDGIGIQGDLSFIEMYTHYYTNSSNTTGNTFYVTLGDQIVWEDKNHTGTEYVTLSNLTLGSYLNYTQLSNNTLPIRIGFENLTYQSEYIGNADVVLVTDVSGSMDWELISSSTGVLRDCDDTYYEDNDTRRISVAKCLDKEFVYDILNTSGNRIGLVSYEASTDNVLSLTTSNSTLYSTIGTSTPYTGYTGGGSTCICCGIESSIDELIANLKFTTFVDKNETWLYWNNSLPGNITNDTSGLAWYERNYDDADWESGNATLGHDLGDSGPTIVTDMGGGTLTIYGGVNFDEISGDQSTLEVEFNGFETTGNTFGFSSGDDGWDYEEGIYGSTDGTETSFGDPDGDTDYDSGNGRIEVLLGTHGKLNGVESGAFGDKFTVSPTVAEKIANGSRAFIRFKYWTDDADNDLEEGVWIKARISNSTHTTYLGSNLEWDDSTEEIWAETGSHHAGLDNIGAELSAVEFEQDITNIIGVAGEYYFDIGAKIEDTNKNSEGFLAGFDDIEIDVVEHHYGYINLWDMESDAASPEVDFSSGVNLTANTFGPNGSDDGWDYQLHTYGQDGSSMSEVRDNDPLTSPSGTRDGSDRISAEVGGTYTEDMDSAAWGVSFEVTQEFYDQIENGSVAIIQFDYEAFDRQIIAGGDGTEESVWIKARFGNSSSMNYLGYDLDSELGEGSHPSDTTPEILWDWYPNNNQYWHNDILRGDFNMDGDDKNNKGTFEQDVSDFITGPGTYYFDVGVKFDARDGIQGTNEGIIAYFDNVLLRVIDTDHYYLRKEFSISDIADAQKGYLNILFDDYVDIYVNGNKIPLPDYDVTGSYYDVQGIKVKGNYLREGTNVIAAHLKNTLGSARFDAEFIGVNTSRNSAMLLMTDGKANRGCSGTSSTSLSKQEAIDEACRAREEYGIVVHAVGISDAADTVTLSEIAECGGGSYFQSDNVDELKNFYQDVARSILEISRQSQVLVVSGGELDSILYPDSYIKLVYESASLPPQAQEIEVVQQTEDIGGCEYNLTIYPQMRVIDAQLLSYSGEHWTDLVTIDGAPVFNLSEFNENYSILGDPFVVHLPSSLLQPGTKQIKFRTGDSSDNSTECSPNSTIVYTVLVPSSTQRSTVVEQAVGCTWTIAYEDGTVDTLVVPAGYGGGRVCSYQPGNITYLSTDAYDFAVYKLLSLLDFDNDQEVYINIEQQDFEIIINIVDQIPFLWGPSVVKSVVWK